MPAPNVFSSLLPNPNEDDFTSALAYVISPNRRFGAATLKLVLSFVDKASDRFDFSDYRVEKQRSGRAGRFDLLISSPADSPRIRIVLENKVELSLDDRSLESVEKYLKWLGDYREGQNLLVLNTKYSIPDDAKVPSDVFVMHWHMIAKAIEDELVRMASDSHDEISKDFLEFLRMHGMGPVESIGRRDSEAVSRFHDTNLKFDFVLEAIKSHYASLGYRCKKNVDLGYDEPYYVTSLRKGDWSQLFNYYIGFYYRTPDRMGPKTLLFVSQLYIEDKKFFDFLESRYATELTQEAVKIQATFDRNYYWTFWKNLENSSYSDLEAERSDLFAFSRECLKKFETSLVPMLEKAAKIFSGQRAEQK